MESLEASINGHRRVLKSKLFLLFSQAYLLERRISLVKLLHFFAWSQESLAQGQEIMLLSVLKANRMEKTALCLFHKATHQKMSEQQRFKSV